MLLELSLIILLSCQLPVYSCGNNSVYIIPSSLNDSIANCPIDSSSCYTLSQFFSTSAAHLEFSNLTLHFLPGNHAFESNDTFLDNLTSVTFKLSPMEGEASIICSSSARLLITNVALVRIQDVTIVGCKDIDMELIDSFILRNTHLNGTTMNMSNIAKVYIEGGLFVNGNGMRTGSGRNLGGVILAINSIIMIRNSTFSENKADRGGVIFLQRSELIVDGSQFQDNFALYEGGVVYLSRSNIHVISSTFGSNTVKTGNAPRTYGLGGVVFAKESNISLHEGNVFMNNKADVGGVIFTLVLESNSSVGIFDINEQCHVNIRDNYFVSNRVLYEGSMMFSYGCDISDVRSTYESNEIDTFQPLDGTYGGVISSTYGFITLNGSSFLGNSAIFRASSLTMINSFTNCYDIVIRDNWSRFNGTNSITEGMIISRSDVKFFGETVFSNNSGTMYIYNSNVTFSGETTIINSTQLSGSEFGGSISTDQSVVKFYGRASLVGNHAINGGAINARESQLYFFGEVFLSGNSAEQAGGAIFLLQSELICQNNCTIAKNSANGTGGGLHAVRSSLRAAVRLSSFHFFNPHLVPEISLNFAENVAKWGGGLSLQSNSKLYVTLVDITQENGLVKFTKNHAAYEGGAIYIADETYSDTCSTTFDHECFFQPVPLRIGMQSNDFTLSGFITAEKVFEFVGNSAMRGPLLFGGLLDRCMLNRTLQIFAGIPVSDAFKYFLDISNISSASLTDVVSSRAVRVCFCRGKRSDCAYRHPPINVTKGAAFNVTIAAVDHVNNTVSADIISSISPQGDLLQGQQHHVEANCTSLTFTVQSPYNTETLVMYASGPCKDSKLSRTQVWIEFSLCTCPIGFQPIQSNKTCECGCDPEIHEYTTNCDRPSSSIIRENTNSWIVYDFRRGYAIYKHCPFDYCLPSATTVSINLTAQHGSDAQCNFNRQGILCGECKSGYSLSFGSSKCMECKGSKLYGGIIGIIILETVGGTLLVSVLLFLNITVAVGTVNGIIFYANIIGASSSVFLRHLGQSFPTIFVAWLNLDTGFDICITERNDAYMKTWLELLFPVYIFVIIIIIITISKYSKHFSNLIGKRDPVATLATMILLSYTKLLRSTIAMLSLARLEYTSTSDIITVWRLDGNILYLRDKHIALFVVALIILLVGIPFTTILFCWQWLVRYSNTKYVSFMFHSKLEQLVLTYFHPFHTDYRYWTGMLLFVRVILYLIAGVDQSGEPQIQLVATTILIGMVILIKSVLLTRVYNKYFIDVLENLLLFNILFLSSFMLYAIDIPTAARAAAYLSTLFTFILLLLIFGYHIIKYTPLKEKQWLKCLTNKYSDTPQEQPFQYDISLTRDSGTFELINTDSDHQSEVARSSQRYQPPEITKTVTASEVNMSEIENMELIT